MTHSVQQLVNSFEALSENEKQQATVELLRRGLLDIPPDLSDESMIAAAEELFLELDAREAANGQP